MTFRFWIVPYCVSSSIWLIMSTKWLGLLSELPFTILILAFLLNVCNPLIILRMKYNVPVAVMI